MKKKAVATVLLLSIIFTIVSCGNINDENANTDMTDNGVSDTFYTEEGTESDEFVTDIESEDGEEIEPLPPDELSTVTPEEIIDGIDADAKKLNTSKNCKMVILKGAKWQKIRDLFRAEDFTLCKTEMVDGARFYTAVFVRDPYVVTVHDFGGGNVRIIWESCGEGTNDFFNRGDSAEKGDVSIAQIGVERTKTSKGNPENGMCYIIKLSDGRAVIIDGGHNYVEPAKNLFESLIKMGIRKNADGKYVIASWIFTHAHGDHIGTFTAFADAVSSVVCVESLMYNMPEDPSVVSGVCDLTAFEKTVETHFPTAKIITPHSGLKYFIGNITINMLYTPELLYSEDAPVAYFNDTSLIFKVDTENGNLLFYGDSGNEASHVMWEAYAEDTFRSNIFQVSHHGLYTEANWGHKWDYLKKVYDATEAEYALLPMHSRYRGEYRNGRYTVLVQWSDQNFQISYVTDSSDNHGMKTVTQDYFDSFVEAAEKGEGDFDTLYGYDGINKIINEKGLITYVGTGNDEPMITVFSFSDGGVTVELNEKLYSWL